MNSGISVADVMRDQVVAVRERARFAEIVTAMRRFHLSSLPVIDSADRVVGLISGHDLPLQDADAGDAEDRQDGLFGRLRRRNGRSACAGRLATDLMSSPPVTTTAATPAREATRAMYRHRIHQLPVIDETTGRLTGTVTRSDLLAVYERPDEDIRREIVDGIIERTLGLPAEGFEVSVAGGAVTIRGRLEHRSAALRLARATAHVEGVITVADHLAYRLDDLAGSPGPR